MELELFWYLLLGVLLFGYAVLDGFDLGVGILHLFVAKTDRERRILMNSIGPLWDGNEVWLVTFGGALFAAFPKVYAAAFSGFYLPFMLLLCCLIFRATALEFRSKRASRWWRGFWDVAFAAASALGTFLMGVSIGNILQGMPMNAQGVYQGTTLDLLNPYAIGVGALAMALFAMHGAIFLYLKTEEQLQERLKEWMWSTFGVFLVLYILVTIFTLVSLPHVTRHFVDFPAGWVAVALSVLAIANIPRAIYRGSPGRAFASSVFVFLGLIVLLGAALYPNLLPNSAHPEWSLTLWNSASSQGTLGRMAWIAVLGMPLVTSYTIIVYWTFRGKVELDKFSY